MDIDDLKKQWHSMDVPDTEVRAMEREVSAGRGVQTLRDRLMRISRHRALACLAGALCLTPLVYDHPVMTAMTMIFFIVMGVMHFVQFRNLRALDMSATTVREALESVLRIETLRSARRIVGIIMAVPLSV